MTTHQTVSRAEWLRQRKELLARERELTHFHDRIATERRALPWVKVEQDYVFDGPSGKVKLIDLFGPRSQLAVYHFMLAPGSDHICNGCAFVADHVDSSRRHFEHADLAFAAVSRASIERIEQLRRRMDWRFNWVSSNASSFNYDFGVSFTDAQVESKTCGYNYGTTPYNNQDLSGASFFARDEAGNVFHTYSAYTRGIEQLVGAFNWLDLASKGRNESKTMSWLKLHDEYDGAKSTCCAAHASAA
jgi:predicted dithiol-disulfide oxidoreductase (DUF899 family)